MLLVDALQCLTDNLVVGVTVETWIARNRADYGQGLSSGVFKRR